MDVFVIPIASDRYELYCEPPGDFDAAESLGPDEVHNRPDAATSRRPRRTRAAAWAAALLDRWRARVVRALKAAERGDVPDPDEASGFLSRLQLRMMKWLAERIAEQRLLWRLRSQTAAVAVHPEDLTFDQVMTLITRTLQRDHDRHRLWLIIDTVGMVLSWPLTFVPGPNMLLYYFIVRVGGHWLSMRGARQGMTEVAWTGRACASLTELRGVAALDPGTRDRRVRDVAARLHLPHLSRFFERVAVPHA
jgi:hypothetical protein